MTDDDNPNPRLAGPLASTLARWDGVCAHCAQPIERGDVIGRHDGVWLHESCAARRSVRELHRPLEAKR